MHQIVNFCSEQRLLLQAINAIQLKTYHFIQRQLGFRCGSLHSSRKEKLVSKKNHKETISDVINVSPTSQNQKNEIPTYSAHNCVKKVKPSGFALAMLLKPSMLSSGFLPVGTNNLLILKKTLVFVCIEGNLYLPLKKPKQNPNKPTLLQLTRNQCFLKSSDLRY